MGGRLPIGQTDRRTLLAHEILLWRKREASIAGTYPEVSLASVREKRDQARKQLSNEIDPAQAKKLEKQLKSLNNDNTFEAIAREWHENKITSWTPRHGTNILHRLPACRMEPSASHQFRPADCGDDRLRFPGLREVAASCDVAIVQLVPLPPPVSAVR
jgi:hypothetical protein